MSLTSSLTGQLCGIVKLLTRHSCSSVHIWREHISRDQTSQLPPIHYTVVATRDKYILMCNSVSLTTCTHVQAEGLSLSTLLYTTGCLHLTGYYTHTSTARANITVQVAPATNFSTNYYIIIFIVRCRGCRYNRIWDSLWQATHT